MEQAQENKMIETIIQYGFYDWYSTGFLSPLWEDFRKLNKDGTHKDEGFLREIAQYIKSHSAKFPELNDALSKLPNL